MPGYLIHLASSNEELRKNSLSFKGLVAPDLWKKETPTEEEYREFFAGETFPPSYEQVLLLCDAAHGGTHFGSKFSDTNHADLNKIVELFSNKKLNSINPFFTGYFQHLLVDKLFYKDTSICDQEQFDADFSTDKDTAMNTLHIDWDKINQSIVTAYPEIRSSVPKLPAKARSRIGFVNGKPVYINPVSLRAFIEKMQKFKTLDEILGALK